MTTNYIIAELVSLFASPLRLARRQIVGFVDGLKSFPHVTIVHIDREIDDLAWKLFRQRLDKQWSLVDCSGFVVMRRHGLEHALTSDRHFEQAGLVQLLKE